MYTLFLFSLAGTCLGIAHGASEALTDQVCGIPLEHLMMGLAPAIILIMVMLTSQSDTGKVDYLVSYGVPFLLLGALAGSVAYQNALRSILSNHLLLAGVTNLVGIVLIVMAFQFHEAKAETKKQPQYSKPGQSRRPWIPSSMMSLIVSGVFLGISIHSFLDTAWIWTSAITAALGVGIFFLTFLVVAIGYFRAMSRKTENRLFDVGAGMLVFFLSGAAGPPVSELFVKPFWPWLFTSPAIMFGFTLFFGLLSVIIAWKNQRQKRLDSW